LIEKQNRNIRYMPYTKQLRLPKKTKRDIKYLYTLIPRMDV